MAHAKADSNGGQKYASARKKAQRMPEEVNPKKLARLKAAGTREHGAPQEHLPEILKNIQDRNKSFQQGYHRY